MSDEDEEKQALKQSLVREIQRRIAYLLTTDRISESQKIAIARNVLNLIEHGEKEGVVQWAALHYILPTK